MAMDGRWNFWSGEIGAFQLGMFILGLFCVDVNVVGGNRGKVEGGLSTWDVYFGIVLC